METEATTANTKDPIAGKLEHPGERTVFAVLFAISFSHMLNDTIQALIPSLYPVVKESLKLNYSQLGLITFAFQCTASLLQPVVGLATDRRSVPYSLAMGMGLTLAGLILLSEAHSFTMIIIAASMVGMGSAVFHPEASRVAHMAAGRNRGFAQSLFQVGGNAGSALGPLLAAVIIGQKGQGRVAWFSLVACVGIFVLWRIGAWQLGHVERVNALAAKRAAATRVDAHLPHLQRGRVIFSLAILITLTFSKFVYLVSMTSYYTFYLIARFGVSVRAAQLYLFAYLLAVAAGTIIGGPVGDRIGRKRVIWVSILGVAPFTLLLPYVGLGATVGLSFCIGVVISSAFPAILVYAQELMPGKVGLVAGLFFGLAFGTAGIGAAVLGRIADHAGIIAVFRGCAYLPLIGLLTIFLPDLETAKMKMTKSE